MNPPDPSKSIHDPTYVGPGLWIGIHRATIDLSPQESTKYIRGLQAKFPCEHCQKHFGDYLETNPPERYHHLVVSYKNQKFSLGMFFWSWQFHNLVNQRLGKTTMSWDTACEIFLEDKKNCDNSCKVSH